MSIPGQISFAWGQKAKKTSEAITSKSALHHRGPQAESSGIAKRRDRMVPPLLVFGQSAVCAISAGFMLSMTSSLPSTVLEYRMPFCMSFRMLSYMAMVSSIFCCVQV